MIASAIALFVISDFYDDYIINVSEEFAEDRDRYRGTAGWLAFVGIVGILVQCPLLY